MYDEKKELVVISAGANRVDEPRFPPGSPVGASKKFTSQRWLTCIIKVGIAHPTSSGIGE